MIHCCTSRSDPGACHERPGQRQIQHPRRPIHRGQNLHLGQIIVLLALLAYIIAFVLINSDHQAVVWLVPTVERSVPTLWVILLTALLVVLTDVVGRRLWRSVKQLRRRG